MLQQESPTGALPSDKPEVNSNHDGKMSMHGQAAKPCVHVNEWPRVESALHFIDSADRDHWLKVGMAIRAEFGDDGFSLWDSWGQRADNYKERDARDVWRSFGESGAVGLGSLFYLAKKAGWNETDPLQVISPEQAEARRCSREEAAKRDAEARAKALAQTQAAAAQLLEAAQPAQVDHPYLVRKQVGPNSTIREIHATDAARIIGYKPSSGGQDLAGRLLVIPLERDDESGPCTVEFIDEAGQKAALAGCGTKTGAYGCLADNQFSPDTVLIGEGAATVLSVLEALADCNAAGFMTSCNTNMPHVAQALRRQHPQARIIILADIIKTTGEPDPKAKEAAQAVSGFLAVPDFGRFRQPEQTDFNDLHVSQGLGAVRACVEAGRQVPESEAPSIWDRPADIGAMLTVEPKPLQCLLVDRRCDPPAPVMPIGRGGLFVGVGGASKTTFLKEVGVGAIFGRWPINEWTFERKGKALLVLTEDTADDLHNSLYHLCRDMTPEDQEAVKNGLIAYPLAGTDVHLLERNKRGAIEKCELFRSLAAKVKAVGGVVFIGLDPAIGLSEGDEMSQADQRALGKMADDLAVQTGATCVLVAHAAKNLLNAQELESHCARGGGAITDAGRFEIVLRTMTANEATKYGVADLEERMSLVQVALTKGNRLPPAAKIPLWFRRSHGGILVSADLQVPEKKQRSDSGKIKESASIVFEALRKAAIKYGQTAHDGTFIGVDMDNLRIVHRVVYKMKKPENGSRAEGQNFTRGVAELVKLGWIESDSQLVNFSGSGSEHHIANASMAIAESGGRNNGTEQNFSEQCSAKRTIITEQNRTPPLYKGCSCSDCSDVGFEEKTDRTSRKSLHLGADTENDNYVEVEA